MQDPGSDFDEFYEEEPRRPLLPPDDRIWRHPSEVNGFSSGVSGDELADARRRWLSSTPSRAGAGAAGIVGAVLAAGVVLIGTHLSGWMPRANSDASGGGGAGGPAVTATMASTSPALHDTGLVPFLSGLSAALVRVVATGDGGKRVATADGVLIGSGGYVLAPTTVLADASSVSVVRSDGEQLIAAVKGVDAGTGLVLLSIDGSGLPHMALSTSRSVPRDSFVLVAWRESKATVAIERLTGWAAKTNFRDGPALLEVCPVSLHLGRAPDGALVVGGDGRIAGLVTGHRHGQAIVTPGWLAARVAAQLATAGHVTHGWLGIAGRTARLASDGKYKVNPAAGDTNARMTSNLRTRGVVVEKVVRDSAAYRAGISRGDVIEALDGRPVYGMAQLQAMLYLLPPSSEVHLEVARGAELSRVDARLQAAA